MADDDQVDLAALRAIIGLFSEQAVLKLKQVVEAIVFKPECVTAATAQKDLNNPSPPIHS